MRPLAADGTNCHSEGIFIFYTKINLCIQYCLKTPQKPELQLSILSVMMTLLTQKFRMLHIIDRKKNSELKSRDFSQKHAFVCQNVTDTNTLLCFLNPNFKESHVLILMNVIIFMQHLFSLLPYYSLTNYTAVF